MDALGIWGGDWRSRAAHRTEWPFPPWALRREPERVFGEPLQQCRHVSRWDKPQELGGERPNHIRLELVPSFSHVFTYYLSTYQFLRYIDIFIHRYISASFLHLFYFFLFQTAVNVNHWFHLSTCLCSRCRRIHYEVLHRRLRMCLGNKLLGWQIYWATKLNRHLSMGPRWIFFHFDWYSENQWWDDAPIEMKRDNRS